MIDEEIAHAINSKLGETAGISYTEIASKALECGRTELAIKVFNILKIHILVLIDSFEIVVMKFSRL